MALFLPLLAEAHPNHGPATSLFSGLAHPFSGIDHLCAMLAVGLWATQRGGRSLWMMPFTFVSVMTLGAVLGRYGIAVPFVEQGIVASVFILGLLIAAMIRLPLTASAALVALFSLFHGYAHGAEMPATASSLIYGIEFIFSTAMLLLFGIGVGLTAKKAATEKTVRCIGGAISMCGLYLMFAA